MNQEINPINLQDRDLMKHLVFELDSSHTHFQQTLKSRYPDLTSYNLKLCIYLKSNLTTKEIASLLSITPDSVKKAKHRLRKKMSLEPCVQWQEAMVLV